MPDKRINEMFGRFRIWYDFDQDCIFFATRWDDYHEQKRTVTLKQAEKIKDILMGGHVEA
jgi:hypothetical protein